ncbi:MAG: hypothetical protein WBI07_15355 [Mobilitalea sp.]
MNLPFGLPMIRESVEKKRDSAADVVTHYDRKLAEYSKILEYYRECLLEYSCKLNDLDKKNMGNQLAAVQGALDITYLREQGEKTFEIIEEMKAELNQKVSVLDTNVVNRLSELTIELQKQNAIVNKQLQMELAGSLEILKKSSKNSNTLLGFLFVFNIFGLSGLAFLVLYVLGYIPF